MTQKFTGNVKPGSTWLTFPAVYVYLVFLPYCLIVYIDIAAVCIDIAIVYFATVLLRQEQHNFVASLYEGCHLLWIQRLMRQHSQIIQLFAEDT